MSAEVLTATAELSRRSWLRWRRKGIGGSDAAAIAGLDPYRSPLAVYFDKTGETDDREPTEAMAWGVRLEQLVAAEFADRTGLSVRRRNAILAHRDRPWMLANVDRVVRDPARGRGVLEIKTTGDWAREQWADGAVPDAALIQLQHYLAVTGYGYGYLAVLIGGRRYSHVLVERDDNVISHLIRLEEDFWDRVEQGRPPAADGSDSTRDTLAALYADSQADPPLALPDSAKDLLVERAAAKADEQAAKARRTETDNRLRQLLGHHELGFLDGALAVTWKPVTVRRVDTKALAADHPRLTRRYTTETTSRRLLVKT